MATIHDVALDANVSPTTVSRYINNRIELPATTAARIDAAIEKLGYRPNLLAKRLSTGRTEAVGLVVPDIREPFFAELAAAVEDEADRHGYTIFMSSTRSDRQREIASLNRLHDRHVDGLIMMTNTIDDGTLAALIGRRKNVVLIDEDMHGVQVPRVFVENERGAYTATRHLIGAGHSRIAYIGGPTGLYSVEQRRAGFERAMAESGHAIPAEYLAGGSFDPSFSYEVTQNLLRLPSPPTAIFGSSDYIVIGILRALKQARIVVPAQMSVVGFDDMPLTELFNPPLTAIHQPVDALGRAGFQALFSLLNGQQPPMLTMLPVELVERESVARPRNGDI